MANTTSIKILRTFRGVFNDFNEIIDLNNFVLLKNKEGKIKQKWIFQTFGQKYNIENIADVIGCFESFDGLEFCYMSNVSKILYVIDKAYWSEDNLNYIIPSMKYLQRTTLKDKNIFCYTVYGLRMARIISLLYLNKSVFINSDNFQTDEMFAVCGIIENGKYVIKIINSVKNIFQTENVNHVQTVFNNLPIISYDKYDEDGLYFHFTQLFPFDVRTKMDYDEEFNDIRKIRDTSLGVLIKRV